MDSRARVWIAPGGVAACCLLSAAAPQGAGCTWRGCHPRVHGAETPNSTQKSTAPAKGRSQPHLQGFIFLFSFKGNVFTPCLQRNRKADVARCPSWPQHPARRAWQGQASAPSRLCTLWSSPHTAQHPETPAPSTQELLWPWVCAWAPGENFLLCFCD